MWLGTTYTRNIGLHWALEGCQSCSLCPSRNAELFPWNHSGLFVCAQTRSARRSGGDYGKAVLGVPGGRVDNHTGRSAWRQRREGNGSQSDAPGVEQG